MWALAVVAFWAFVFCLMFFFVYLISRGRDNEEIECPLPAPSHGETMATSGHAPA